jgi:hypothetical protein
MTDQYPGMPGIMGMVQPICCIQAMNKSIACCHICGHIVVTSFCSSRCDLIG